MARPPPSAVSTKSSFQDFVPVIPVKEETRDLVVTEPRYNDGVLEGMWRDRRIEKTKACAPPFRGCSIYTTSFKEPPREAFLDDYASQAAWDNRAGAEGLHRAILLEASGPKCRENFTTTTDLMHHWMPQACATARAFNSRHLEWLPSQDLLPCLGNLTQYGLKELTAARWAAERAALRAKPVTTHRAHFHQPCDSHRETSRRAVCRLFSSKIQTNNNILHSQLLRGKQVLVAPNVLQGQYPLDVCRDRLPIVPELPLESAPVLRVPDRSAGPHPFPACCTGVRRCRRVPGGTPITAPALPFYSVSCQPAPPTGLL
ncbi:uncharacterized protein LOC113208927 [Frankliniella occidentalis]|uniref:Uncharacterized protein LOC113208927 n=1 Tax=Frankliniella occidentalis TaxID=133901 RepID=A0A6J1STZ2_FRAOC|nr:uncharacterized protein LOC113208927 [Frankliniella occidentalis]